MRRPTTLALFVLLALVSGLSAANQSARQPKVTPGPEEPDWIAILDAVYGLRMFGDLANPVTTSSETVPGLFRKAGNGPVRYTPVMALGLVTTTRGGWYAPGQDARSPQKRDLWSYTFKNTGADIENDTRLPPPREPGSAVEFDPGNAPFGLWVSNDGLKDGGAFTEPKVVAAINARLAKQPYKVMIYPLKDKATGKVVPHAYLLGWEYSTNDDFQDVVCVVENADLIVP